MHFSNKLVNIILYKIKFVWFCVIHLVLLLVLSIKRYIVIKKTTLTIKCCYVPLDWKKLSLFDGTLPKKV